ncbi:MAG: hypothetical protein AAB861_00465 [Patescibacteria group bacterium]
MSQTFESEVIEPGMLVGLRKNDKNEDVQNRLLRWAKAYGRGPYTVKSMISSEHAILERNGEVIHFGSTASAALNVGFIEPWRG